MKITTNLAFATIILIVLWAYEILGMWVMSYYSNWPPEQQVVSIGVAAFGTLFVLSYTIIYIGYIKYKINSRNYERQNSRGSKK